VSRCFIRHRQPQGGQVHYIHAPVKTSNDRSGLQRLRLLLSAYFKTNCLDEKTVPVFIHRQCKTWSTRLQRRHNVFITSRANMDTCCCRHQMTVRDLHLSSLYCVNWALQAPTSWTYVAAISHWTTCGRVTAEKQLQKFCILFLDLD